MVFHWSLSDCKSPQVSRTRLRIYYYYYYFDLFEFSLPVETCGILLEFEWQQVSSSLKDSTQYFSRSHWCCNLDSILPLISNSSGLFFKSLWGRLQAHQLRLVSQSPLCSTVYHYYHYYWKWSRILQYLKPFNCVQTKAILETT